MKNFTLTILLIMTICFAGAQTPQLQWANALGQPNDPDMGIKLMPDNNGNLFFYGRFSGTVDFDPGPGVTNLTAGGNFDIVIGKYSSSGTLIWVKKIGGSVIAVNNGHAIFPFDAAVDNAGNLFITGEYVGIVDIDPSAANYLLQPHPVGIWSGSIFIASYTNNGDLRWGYGFTSYWQFSGTFNSGYHIRTDNAGDVIMSGMYHGTIDFDPSAGTSNLTANGNYMDIFFTKYSNTGSFIWAKTITGGGVQDTPTDMVIDNNNNIYLCGYIDLATDFNPSSGGAIVNSNGGGGDVFLAKYNSSGDYQWAFSAGSSISYDVPGGLGIDNAGNVCMGGYFRGTVDFDPSSATFNLTSTGTTAADAFLTKYSAAGNLLWAKSFGGDNHENMGDMAIDQYGRIIISGDFRGTCDFDPSPVIELLDAGTSPTAAFVVQFDNDGNFLNVMAINGPGSYLFDHGLVIDNNETIYYTGGFEGTADFDPSAATHNLTASSTYQDIYMSSYQIGSAIVSGRIWNDANSNGIVDGGELGLPNIKVDLIYDRNNNNVVDAYDGFISTTTLADGAYAFNAVAEGNYLLSVLPQAGYNSTTPLLVNADLTAGQTISNMNFGFAPSVLAVACGGFSGTMSGNAVVLQWKTLSEVNSKGFNLQRSTDGITFQNITWVNAQGNSTGSFNYSYTDNAITGRTNYYYRLQEIELSGTAEYICSILLIRANTQKAEITIYPNPVDNFLNVSEINGNSYLTITDLSGRKLKEIFLNNTTGRTTVQIPVSALKTGIYFLNIYTKEGRTYSTKLFKL